MLSQFAGSQESILNIDVDLDMNQHYWHRGRHRNSSGDEIEVVHIPISSPMARSNRRRQRHARSHSNGQNSVNNSGQSQSQSSSAEDSSSPNSVTEPLKESINREELAPEVVADDHNSQTETNRANECSDCRTQTDANIEGSHVVDDDCQPLSSESGANRIQITLAPNDSQCLTRTEPNNTYDRLCSEQKY